MCSTWISDSAWGIKHASAGVGYAALSGVWFESAQRGLHALGPLDFRECGQRELGTRDWGDLQAQAVGKPDVECGGLLLSSEAKLVC